MTLLPLMAALALAGATPPDTTAEKAEIVRLEDAWRRARIEGDIAFLERFYAREMRVQAMDGKVVSRADDIAMFRNRIIQPRVIDHGPLDVTLYGDTAVVTGVDHMEGTAFGRAGELWLRFADVLVKRDGRWQLVLQQATPTPDR